jgi:opacity protein-like surface antigen
MKPVVLIRRAACVAVMMMIAGATQVQAQYGPVKIGPGVSADIFRDDLCWERLGYIFKTTRTARDFQENLGYLPRDTSFSYTRVDAPSGGGKTVKATITFKSGNVEEFIRVPCPPPETATLPPGYPFVPFSPEIDRQTSALWNGPFAGVQVTGEWSGVDTSEFNGAGVRTFQSHDTGSGVGGGFDIGWNWQPWSNRFVVGVVGDANWLNDRVRHDFAGGNYIGTDMTFMGSAQVRGGVLVNPSFLLYVQTGVAVANQQFKIDFGGPETNESQWTPGYTLGFGFEAKLPIRQLSFGRTMSVFAEYSHTQWDTSKLHMPVASPLFDYSWIRQTDAVKVGARVSWGDGPPQ